MTILIKNGTVVSATGSYQADVLIDGETIAAVIGESLEASGLPADRLVIELTETSLLEASASTLADVRALTGSGVTLAVDDFGTGFSSLAYLKRFPVDALKIDRAFVMGLGEDDEDRDAHGW